MRLRDVIADPRHSLEQVVSSVMLDPMLAGVVLRLANTVEFAQKGPTTHLATAVQRIGDSRLSKLAMASLLTSDANTPGPLREVRQARLQRALLTAYACERLAQHFEVDEQTAFLVGLLNDIGTLVVLNTLELIIGQHGFEARDAASWLALAAEHHVAVASVVCARWGLPSALQEALAQREAGSAGSALGRLLWLVEELVDGLESGLTLEELAISPRLTELVSDSEARTRALARLVVLPSLVGAFVEEGGPTVQACVSLVTLSPPPVEGQWFEGELTKGRRARVLLDAQGTVRMIEAERLTSGLLAVTVTTPSGPVQVWLRTFDPMQVAGHTRATTVPFALDQHSAARLREAVRPDPGAVQHA